MKKALYILVAIILAISQSHAQIGGESTYAFLRLNTSANYSSLGGMSPSVEISGPNGAWVNPALVDTTSHQSAATNMVQYVADIRYGSAAYTHRIHNTMLTCGAMMLHYGSFALTDEAANVLGTFSCRDLLAMASASRQIAPAIRLGASAKIISSKMEQYTSQGVAMDLGIIWELTLYKTTLAATISNMGFQISTYNGIQEKLPLDIRLGISKTLEHAPIRLSATLHNLQKPKLGDKFAESLANHFILSAEIFPEGVFSIKGGFNFLNHNNLYVADGSLFPGFSIGMDVRLKRFSIQYSRHCISPAASANMFSAEIFIGRFINR